jgi:hypothetical protein
MKLASSFTVPAAADKVVTLFLDPTTMRSCIPGCEDLIQIDETHYKGSLVNEVAHVRFKAGFTAEVTAVSMPGDTAQPAIVTAVLRGEDRRLGSTIRIDATLTVTPLSTGTDGGTGGSGDASEVSYEFELAIRGKLGRLGESVIRRRTVEVERQFTVALTAVCTGRPVPWRGEGETDNMPDAAVLRSVSATPLVSADARTVAPVLQPAGTAHGAAAPAARQPRQDWLLLGLAVAAAFAYGILVGGRKGGRR